MLFFLVTVFQKEKWVRMIRVISELGLTLSAELLTMISRCNAIMVWITAPQILQRIDSHGLSSENSFTITKITPHKQTLITSSSVDRNISTNQNKGFLTMHIKRFCVSSLLWQLHWQKTETQLITGDQDFERYFVSLTCLYYLTKTVFISYSNEPSLIAYKFAYTGF